MSKVREYLHPIFLLMLGVPLMFIVLAMVDDPDTRIVLIGLWLGVCGVVGMTAEI